MPFSSMVDAGDTARVANYIRSCMDQSVNITFTGIKNVLGNEEEVKCPDVVAFLEKNEKDAYELEPNVAVSLVCAVQVTGKDHKFSKGLVTTMNRSIADVLDERVTAEAYIDDVKTKAEKSKAKNPKVHFITICNAVLANLRDATATDAAAASDESVQGENQDTSLRARSRNKPVAAKIGCQAGRDPDAVVDGKKFVIVSGEEANMRNADVLAFVKMNRLQSALIPKVGTNCPFTHYDRLNGASNNNVLLSFLKLADMDINDLYTYFNRAILSLKTCVEDEANKTVGHAAYVAFFKAEAALHDKDSDEYKVILFILMQIGVWTDYVLAFVNPDMLNLATPVSFDVIQAFFDERSDQVDLFGKTRYRRAIVKRKAALLEQHKEDLDMCEEIELCFDSIIWRASSTFRGSFEQARIALGLLAVVPESRLGRAILVERDGAYMLSDEIQDQDTLVKVNKFFEFTELELARYQEVYIKSLQYVLLSYIAWPEMERFGFFDPSVMDRYVEEVAKEDAARKERKARKALKEADKREAATAAKIARFLEDSSFPPKYHKQSEVKLIPQTMVDTMRSIMDAPTNRMTAEFARFFRILEEAVASDAFKALPKKKKIDHLEASTYSVCRLYFPLLRTLRDKSDSFHHARSTVCRKLLYECSCDNGDYDPNDDYKVSQLVRLLTVIFDMSEDVPAESKLKWGEHYKTDKEVEQLKEAANRKARERRALAAADKASNERRAKIDAEIQALKDAKGDTSVITNAERAAYIKAKHQGTVQPMDETPDQVIVINDDDAGEEEEEEENQISVEEPEEQAESEAESDDSDDDESDDSDDSEDEDDEDDKEKKGEKACAARPDATKSTKMSGSEIRKMYEEKAKAKRAQSQLFSSPVSSKTGKPEAPAAKRTKFVPLKPAKKKPTKPISKDYVFSEDEDSDDAPF